MSKRQVTVTLSSSRRARLLRLALLLLGLVIVAAASAPLWAPLHPTTRAAYNVAEYRARRWWWDQFGAPQSVGGGSLSGWVTDATGEPVPAALVLVASATGETFSARTDETGFYSIEDIPGGSYRPIAAAWGYDLPAETQQPQAGPSLRFGETAQRLDPVLSHRIPPALSAQPESLQLGLGIHVTSDFPTPAVAIRRHITFTHESILIDGDLLYTPATEDGPWPLLVVAYPNTALNWEKATIQFAAAGYAVLAITPDPERALDLEAHARDLRMAVNYAQNGQLSPAIAGPDFVLLTGSFGSIYGYRALPDLEHLRAIANLGGVSDAFLGIQALYSENLAIPAPYDTAIAAMGRPDHDPGYFLAYSPVFWAAHHPPTLLIHTYEDEVIPYNQSQRLADALAAAGIPHDLWFYHSDTHYLDPRSPTAEAVAVFERVLAFVEAQFETE